MSCVICNGQCHNCSTGPFKGLRLKENYLSEISLEGMIEQIQENATRHSISGVQTKLLATIHRGKLSLAPRGEYILKPIPSANFRLIDDVPANEHLSMRLASNVYSLETAVNGLIEIDGRPVYITKRFDINPGGTRNIQEDFAQLAKRTEALHGQNFKYDYSYEEFSYIINNHFASPLITNTRVLNLIIFNYIIGNGDAHLKNFSGYQSSFGDLILTPYYDLLSTKIHTPDEKITALDIFKDYETDFYTVNGYPGQESFRELGRRVGVIDLESILEHYQSEDNKNKALGLIDTSPLSDQAKELYSQTVAERVDILNRL